MICKKCGKEISDVAKFCGYCGEKVEQVDVNKEFSWIAETKPKDIGTVPVVEQAPVVETNVFNEDSNRNVVGSSIFNEENALKSDSEFDSTNLEDKVTVSDKPIEPLPIVEKDSFKIDVLEDKIEKDKKEEEKSSNNSLLKVLLVLFLLLTLSLGGYIIYDKVINKEEPVAPIKEIKEEDSKEEDVITETEALEIATTKYTSIYGEAFNSMYYDLITNDNKGMLESVFTSDAIEKLKLNKAYTIGIFGTNDQAIRTLNIVSYDENNIVALGKNETDTYSYYIVFKNISNKWYIDMFE